MNCVSKRDESTAKGSEENDVPALISQLCRQFYTLGWVSGTGGGISIKFGESIFIAPSGVQKERIDPSDVFELNSNGECVREPCASKKLKMSECTPLFMNAYRLRNAGAVIHSHDVNANLVTLLATGNEFKISNQEMIKGIKKGSSNESHRYDDTLIVPIIENTAFERDLTESMAKAINDYPNTNAVLVRRHGVYVWGPNWQSAKTMAECYHYLFEIALKMKLYGLKDS
ncbi:putative methylthioribulose-1-phosphate dehydratase-like protein [Dinothrombium tinctorium]|uniref:Probable methylthioribulose-1-phosphate dehydratase n=1 Tax=Dinothrombium tinctorium TaxID=1965070 RepID=A0A443QLP4_9ACAR|nr:putative methylthioribulose-1-phosphate dehydratase-like protein [Dinothrombium tinctorium]